MSLFDMSSMTELMTESMISPGGNDPDFPGVITGGCDTSGMFPEQGKSVDIDGSGGGDSKLIELLTGSGGGGVKAAMEGEQTLSAKDEALSFGSIFNDNPAWID